MNITEQFSGTVAMKVMVHGDPGTDLSSTLLNHDRVIHQEVSQMTFTSFPVRVPRVADLAGRAIETDLTDLWMKGIKAVLSLLILTILIALTGGVIKTFLDIKLLLEAPVEVGLRQIIVDTLILLAVVEVFKTTLTYFSEGRVKVTFIVDTILVVMLTEIISLWFKEADQTKLLSLGAIVLALGAVRVVAVRCSPAQGDGNGKCAGSCREGI